MRKLLIFLLASLISLTSVFAAREMMYDDAITATSAGAGLAIFMIVLFILLFAVGILGTIFWIWMLVDCAKREFDSKVAWILILVFTGVIGAILYYFIVKKKA